MSRKDYYKILGVDKNADAAAIKKAYRTLAKRYHPDANHGDKSAEEKFKEINEAYQTLNDPKKRAEYDNPQPEFTANPGGSYSYGPNIHYETGGFDGFDDIFSEIFHNMGGSHNGFHFYEDSDTGAYTKTHTYSNAGSYTDADGFTSGYRQTAPRRGKDLEKQLQITLEEADSGCQKTCKLRRETVCPNCGGTGKTQYGTRCTNCAGTGKIKTEENKTLKVPAGVADGQVLKIRGAGSPGKNGGEYGDLLITIRIKAHPYFTRKGDDLYTTVELTVPQAVLGCEVDIPTLKGTEKFTFPQGTQPGQLFCIRGEGARKLNGDRGDLYVTSKVTIPKRLTAKQRELYEELDGRTVKKKTARRSKPTA